MKTRSLAVIAFLLYTSFVSATMLTSVVFKESAHQTSIYCKLTDLPSYRSFMLNSPSRAVVDFQNTIISNTELHRFLGNQYIAKMRVGHPDPKSLRLVFDLRTNSAMRVFWVKSDKNQSGVLRIDILSQAMTKPIVKNKVVTNKIVHEQLHLIQPKAVRPHQQYQQAHKPMRDVVVVIDAGHGGKDPGAIGPMRHAEKHIVLTIAMRLKQLIDKQPGMRAVLTRSGDYYVGLRQRLDLARRYNADMFVSIHADAFNNRNSTGASVYALSQSGATSEAARWLAEKENYSELGGVDLSGLDDKNGLVRSVLIDLSQTATSKAGLKIGGSVLHSLNQMTNLHHSEVEQARFVVLKSPDIPSILVETGFISNPREEYNLNNAGYQSRLSYAIFNGIKKYFWDNPPHGSRVEAMLGGDSYLARPVGKSG